MKKDEMNYYDANEKDKNNIFSNFNALKINFKD